MIAHLLYSPNKSPSNYFTLPKMNLGLKGNHFDSSVEIQTAKTTKLKSILQENFAELWNTWRSVPTIAQKLARGGGGVPILNNIHMLNKLFDLFFCVLLFHSMNFRNRLCIFISNI